MPKGTARNRNTNKPPSAAAPPDTGRVSSPFAPVQAWALSQYDEQQNDEIKVLGSVFPEDFEQVETRRAWSRQSEKSFRIRLSAESDSLIYARLTVVFTATYPKTAPLLSLTCSSNVPEKTHEKLQYLLEARPRELAGEVMVLEICNEIRDVLEDAARAIAEGRAVPSLEQERAHREAEAERLAQEQQQRDAIKAIQEKQTEERAMQQMVEVELKRRDLLRQKHQPNPSDETGARSPEPSDVWFDQPIKIDLASGITYTFQAVSVVRMLKHDSLAATMEVQAQADSTLPKDCIVPHMALKRFSVPQSRAKKSVLDLEDDLEKLKSLSHENLFNVLDFNIQHIGHHWQFDILLEEMQGSSVHTVLDIVQYMPVQNTRLYAIDILQALDFLHRNGLSHGALHAENVLICNGSDNKIVKLANGGLDCRFHEIMEDNVDLYWASRYSQWPVTWKPPELLNGKNVDLSAQKKDIWEFGVLMIQMLMGIEMLTKDKPALLPSRPYLTSPLRDLLRDVLRADPKKRPSAFDLIPYEFFRTNCAATEESQGAGSTTSGRGRPVSHHQGAPGKPSLFDKPSRYTNEWFEVGRLGRGGFGEVVKARNKVDGRVYAIKRIACKTQAQLSEVLSEVYLLATLNHPYVVRYYTAWPEQEHDQQSDREQDEEEALAPESTRSSSVFDDQSHLNFAPSVGGIDFISSSGYPKIEFGNSEEDESDSNGDRIDESTSTGCRPSSEGQPLRLKAPEAVNRATLYIQMELCEKLTLRDLIRRKFQDNDEEIWKIFRQIVEGLVHIHGHGIIHRDLKPENIFIDLGNNPKIGDFGLATAGHRTQLQHRHTDQTPAAEWDLTMSVGTALYTAPELQSIGIGHYTNKVDVYSLGIILFEMCHEFATAMERCKVILELRQDQHSLPAAFQNPEKALQAQIILSLIKYNPSERPSSLELLRSRKIPLRIEDEHISQALSSLSDPSSPIFTRIVDVLFSKIAYTQLQNRLWDQSSKSVIAPSGSTDYFSMQALVKENITSIFRRYGAIEGARHGIFPKSEYYLTEEVSHLLDPTGVVVQLPYDLILPHARAVAREAHVAARSFAFGVVYRASAAGGAPRSNREADFDIISKDGEDLRLAEAEVVKCLDDLIIAFPCFNKTPVCFHLSHSSVLDTILDFCRIPQALQQRVKDILGKLHIGAWTWHKIRTELRAPPIGITSSSIDDLAHFDFRDTPERTLKRLQVILKTSPYVEVIGEVFTKVSELVEYLNRFGMRRKIYFSPLSSVNEKFYRSNIMFQCLFDGRKRDIFAAGGRYDSLISGQQPHPLNTCAARHGVGANIAWERIVMSMTQMQRRPAGTAHIKKSDLPTSLNRWASRRCDVLVASFDPVILRSIGIKIVSDLRANDIKAELTVDAQTPEQLTSHYSTDNQSWLVIIKHEGLSSGKPDLKVKSLSNKGESADIHSLELVNFIRGELREREEREGHDDRIKLLRQPSQPDGGGREAKADVHMLTANHKSKKTNKARVIEDAQGRVRELLAGYREGPIAAVEIRDESLARLRETKLSEPDSWRKVIQQIPLSEHKYSHDLFNLIESFKGQYGESTRKCFVYNFRTGYCLDYDLWS